MKLILWSIGISAAVIAVVSAMCFTRVPVGDIGLRVNLYGSDRETPEIVSPGGVLFNPITQEIVTFPTVEQPFQIPLTFNVNGAGVDVEVSGSYQVIVEQAPELYVQYRLDAEEYQNQIASRTLRNCFNEEASSLQPEALITEERNSLLVDVESCFNGYNPGYQLSQLGLVGSPRFDERIQSSITARLTADQETQRLESEANRQALQNSIELSNAQNNAAIANLEGESVTPETIRLRELDNEAAAIQRWDGKLPATYSGGDMPFLNLLSEGAE